jgi:signal transduction histidine kinase
MSRYLPQSLFGQTVLILLVGLIVSHAVGSWIYTTDREQAVRAVGGFATAQRIANLTRLLQDTPREARQRLVTAISDQSFRVSLSTQPLALPPANDDDALAATAIRDFLVGELSLGSARQPLVWTSSVAGPPFGPLHHMLGHGPMMTGFAHFAAFRDLQVSIPLPEGQWLAFATALPAGGPAYSSQFLLAMGVMALIIVVVSVWAVRRVTAPLASLATAAERLGHDVNALPLPETGTTETRQAARAFNDMQMRLRGLIENRTRLLAAVSHDLRTPLTLLRLRAETVKNVEERDKMLSTIAEMDSLIGTTLQFAREGSVSEHRQQTDLTALVQSVVDEMKDAGHPVRIEPATSIPYACQPAALKRAVRNLLENAVKYGKRGSVGIYAGPRAIAIDVDDDGPGIPETELKRVLEPFYRLEGSRNRETGGVGLGLAITQSIVQAHGGKLMLSNRSTGGLRASIVLPLNRDQPSPASRPVAQLR